MREQKGKESKNIGLLLLLVCQFGIRQIDAGKQSGLSDDTILTFEV
jgi:hypothetical protein